LLLRLVIRPVLAPANDGRRPTSPSAGKPLIFNPDLVIFVSLVFFVKSAEGAA